MRAKGPESGVLQGLSPLLRQAGSAKVEATRITTPRFVGKFVEVGQPNRILNRFSALSNVTDDSSFVHEAMHIRGFFPDFSDLTTAPVQDSLAVALYLKSTRVSRRSTYGVVKVHACRILDYLAQAELSEEDVSSRQDYRQASICVPLASLGEAQPMPLVPEGSGRSCEGRSQIKRDESLPSWAWLAEIEVNSHWWTAAFLRLATIGMTSRIEY